MPITDYQRAIAAFRQERKAHYENTISSDPESLDSAFGCYSDYHKDVFGFRPHWSGSDPGQPLAKVELIEAMVGVDVYVFAMKSTPEGRAQLRAEGWVVEEPAPEAPKPRPRQPKLEGPMQAAIRKLEERMSS